MTEAPVTATGDAGSLRVTIDTAVVQQVFERAPKIVHYWLQGFLSRAFQQHRSAWLKKKGSKFGRGGTGIKVHQLNQGPAAPGPKDVVYNVEPKEQRAATPQAARQGLAKMRAEAFAGSIALRVHEFGEDIRTAQFMAIPVKTRPGTPRAWLAQNPSKRLEYRPSKKHPGEAVLYEVTRKRLRGRGTRSFVGPGLAGPGLVGQERLRLRFLLKRFVDMQPTLHMYNTWDELRAQRDQLWQGAADRMASQLQRGDPRDF